MRDLTTVTHSTWSLSLTFPLKVAGTRLLTVCIHGAAAEAAPAFAFLVLAPAVPAVDAFVDQ